MLLILPPFRFTADATSVLSEIPTKKLKSRSTGYFPLYFLPPAGTPGHLKPTYKSTWRKNENREKTPKNTAYKGIGRKKGDRTQKKPSIQRYREKKGEKKPKKNTAYKGRKEERK